MRTTTLPRDQASFVIDAGNFEPAYMRLYRSGELQRRARAAVASLAECRACPRDCGVDRLRDKTAACKSGRYARVSSHFPHFGEEDCLRGWNGSGTIFFAWCNLRCVFCLHPDSTISTDRGALRIADLYGRGDDEQALDGGYVRFGCGMRAVTRQGRLADIAKLFRHSFAGELVKVKPFSCPTLMLTPDHRVFVASRREPAEVRQIPASALTKDYYLLVPKRIARGSRTTVQIAEIIARHEAVFRKTPHRTSLVTLSALFAQPLTSAVLAELTGYHPAYVRKLRGAWRRGALRAGDDEHAPIETIVEDGRVRFKTEKPPGIPACIALDERLAWLLGIFCAEGHVTRATGRPNAYRLVFSFGGHETDLINRTRQWLEDLFGIRARIVHRRTTITVEAGKASLGLLFAELCGPRAHHKRVPAVLFEAAPSITRSFLRGVLDGDGCERESHWAVNTTSESFARGLFEIGLRHGLVPSFHRWLPPDRTRIEGRTVRQSPLYWVKFPKLDPHTQAPRTRWKETDAGYLLPIHKIERVPYDGPVYNLEIDDPDHSYLACGVAVGNCQNYDISQSLGGVEASPERLAQMMLELQAQGCHNINFVTPEHVVPQILEALPLAIERGLRLPLVYNTSAYDSLESLRHMDGVVDIYMPDFKIWDSRAALKYLLAKDYPEAARRAIREMHRQVGGLQMDGQGLAKRGVLVRHLVMPGSIAGTREIMAWLAREVSPHTYVNLMAQYYPAGRVRADKFAEINRRLTTPEFDRAVAAAREAGLYRFDERRPRLAWL